MQVKNKNHRFSEGIWRWETDVFRRSKERGGGAALKIFTFVFGALSAKSSACMQMLLTGGDVEFHKDTFYRFLKSCRTNWRRFNLLLSSRGISKTIGPLPAGIEGMYSLSTIPSLAGAARKKGAPYPYVSLRTSRTRC